MENQGATQEGTLGTKLGGNAQWGHAAGGGEQEPSQDTRCLETPKPVSDVEPETQGPVSPGGADTKQHTRAHRNHIPKDTDKTTREKSQKQPDSNTHGLFVKAESETDG